MESLDFFVVTASSEKRGKTAVIGESSSYQDAIHLSQNNKFIKNGAPIEDIVVKIESVCVPMDKWKEIVAIPDRVERIKRIMDMQEIEGPALYKAIREVFNA